MKNQTKQSTTTSLTTLNVEQLSMVAGGNCQIVETNANHESHCSNSFININNSNPGTGDRDIG